MILYNISCPIASVLLFLLLLWRIRRTSSS